MSQRKFLVPQWFPPSSCTKLSTLLLLHNEGHPEYTSLSMAVCTSLNFQNHSKTCLLRRYFNHLIRYGSCFLKFTWWYSVLSDLDTTRDTHITVYLEYLCTLKAAGRSHWLKTCRNMSRHTYKVPSQCDVRHYRNDVSLDTFWSGFVNISVTSKYCGYSYFKLCYLTMLSIPMIHSFISSLSDDRSTAFSKMFPPLNVI